MFSLIKNDSIKSDLPVFNAKLRENNNIQWYSTSASESFSKKRR